MALNLIHVFFNLLKGLPAVDDIKHENLGFFLLVCVLSLMHQKKDLPKSVPQCPMHVTGSNRWLPYF